MKSFKQFIQYLSEASKPTTIGKTKHGSYRKVYKSTGFCDNGSCIAGNGGARKVPLYKFRWVDNDQTQPQDKPRDGHFCSLRCHQDHHGDTYDERRGGRNYIKEEADPYAVEHHFEAAAASGALMKTPSIHPHVGNDYSGVRAWQGPSGHFYTTKGNTTPGYGFKEEHTDIAHQALDASRDKTSTGNHSAANYGRAFRGGMIRVRQTPTHLYVETYGVPTSHQVNALVNHAKHTKTVLIDHRNQYTVYGGSMHEHKEGQTGTYLAGIRHALTNPKPDPDAQ